MYFTRTFLCLLCATTISLASSKNRCMLSPPVETYCSENDTQPTWIAFPSAQDKNIRECLERRTCNSSNYFSTKEDCEKSCALKCIKPQEDPPYRPNSIIVHRMEGDRLRYGVFSQCAIGYTMVGDDERTCQDDGNWSGQEPHCYEMMISVHNSSGQYDLDSSNMLEVDEGKQLMLSCMVKDEHRPQFGISWGQVKDGNVADLPIMHDMKIGTSKSGDYVYIQFHRVSNAHERVYSCRSQKYPHLSRNITLQIKPKDSRAPEIYGFTNKVEKTDLRLSCGARGIPVPTMTLLKDGVLVNIIPINVKGSETVFQKLITNPDIKDVGNYVCKAENDYGEDEKYLTVTAEELGIVMEDPLPGSNTNGSSSQCNMCPHRKLPVVKTCNGSNTVVSAQVVDKTDKDYDVLYTIKEGQVIKGSNSTPSMIKITHEALACDCPTFDSESWYVFTGVVQEDMLIVTDGDTACPASEHHIHTLKTHCRAMV